MMPALLFVPLVTIANLPEAGIFEPVIAIESVIGAGNPVTPKSIVEIEFEGFGGTEKEVTPSVVTGLPWRYVANDQWIDSWMTVAARGANVGTVREVIIRLPGDRIKRLRVWIKKVQAPAGR